MMSEMILWINRMECIQLYTGVCTSLVYAEHACGVLAAEPPQKGCSDLLRRWGRAM